MPTDDERREVARKLREEFGGKWGCTSFTELARAVSAGDDDLFDEMFDEMGDVKYEMLTDRLADLIEPERRVCEQCGKPYYPTAKDQKYCCKQCKKDHYISERLSREGEVPEYITKVYGLEVEDAD